MTELPSTPTQQTLLWVEKAVGRRAHITSIRPIRLGSTAVHAVDVLDRDGRVHRLALRRFVDAERLLTDPWYVPANEAKVLELLAGTGVLAPNLLSADLEAEMCDAPTLLTSRIPGRTPGTKVKDRALFFSQLADQLTVIHEVGGEGVRQLPTYQPYYQLSEIEVPAWSRRPDLWVRVFDALAGLPPATPHCFIHRDYHPENTLWSRGRLCGVVDWTTGCFGPPGIDLARMRQDLAGDYGLEWADEFLAVYEARSGRGEERHPYLDLLDAADSLPDLPYEPDNLELRGLERFEEWVARVVAGL